MTTRKDKKKGQARTKCSLKASQLPHELVAEISNTGHTKTQAHMLRFLAGWNIFGGICPKLGAALYENQETYALAAS
jgi:hypothetical protein